MTLDELLTQVRERRLILLQHGSLWAPNTHVPMVTRQAIREYKGELLRLLTQADVRVCPNQNWHKAYWKHVGQGRYVCEVCERIAV